MKDRLDRAFNPKTVAVVGDKWDFDYMWLRCMSTFSGRVYSVQIDPKEIPQIEALGVKNYPSLLDIPEPVDYVVIAVPRGVAPRIVEDCIKKGVGGVMLFTSGFAETGTDEGIRLQGIIAQRAQEAGLNLIGPNCMGIFNPKIGLRNSVDQYYGEGGPVGFISQSGTHSIYFSLVGAENGLKISKSVSYGNAVVLDSPDYLEYLAQDGETKVIGLYIEGVKDGRRFFKVLREVAPEKPVLIWKGGETEAGCRATASHTGVLAESQVVWEGLIRQCGAVKVDSLEEMVDTVKALLFLKPALGPRVGLVAMTGGQSVVISDTFAKAGLEVPLLSQASYQRLAAFFNIIGGSYKNPMDAASTIMVSPESLSRLLEILDEDENIDAIVLEVSVGLMARWWQRFPQLYTVMMDTLAGFRERSQKPFLVVVFGAHLDQEAKEVASRLQEQGIPTYPNFERGARALSKAVDYHRFHAS